MKGSVNYMVCTRGFVLLQRDIGKWKKNGMDG